MRGYVGGTETVDSIPLQTLEGFRDHGDPASRLEEDVDGASAILEKVKAAGIDMEAMALQLENEGIDKFTEPFQKLLDAIKKNQA